VQSQKIGRSRPRHDLGDKEVDESLAIKSARLGRILSSLGSVVVAFSGGVDSALLLAVGKEALDDGIIAVTASSPLYPAAFIERASRIARLLGVEHIILETKELEDAGFVSNPPERCYLCKRELYGTIARIAAERGVNFITDGTQADDTGDYRPGMKAAGEFGVRSPLLEAGFTKADVRALSREIGLETWDILAGPCLASRIPYEENITPAKLEAIEKGENLLAGLGFREVRVRYTAGPTARIEVEPEEIERMLDSAVRNRIVREMKCLGFRYVTLDLQGYRTGSMNEVL